jgi:iron(III) transport system substrate-binding protein
MVMRYSRRQLVRLLLSGAAVCLAACAPGPIEPTPTPRPPVAAPAPQAREETARDAAEADVDRAKKEGKVMLYTSLDTKIVDAIIKPFKEKYGIEVEYFRAGSAQVSGKVLAEADAGKTLADVVDASDVGAFLEMKRRRLLKPYSSPVTRSIPPHLRDPEGEWVASRLTQAVIQWNTNAVKSAEAPKAWKDLMGDRWRNQLAFFSASSGDGAPRLYTLAQAFGWEYLETLAATKPLRVDTPQLLTQILEKGERAVGFAQNDNIAWRSKLEGKPTDFVFPGDGVPTELGAVGVLRNAPHPNAALLFYDWWMGDEGQRLLVEGGKYSPRPEFEPPKGNPPLSQLKLLVLDYADYQAKRPEILRRMAQIFGGEWGA